MLLRTAGSFLRFFLLFQSAAALGFSSDPRLLQLVPPESQVIAGMRSQSMPGKLSSLLLVTRNNEVDHEDFFALTGRDLSRSIREVVFVAAADAHGKLTEHSLLVGGHFDHDAIFRSATDGGATRESYRGLAVVAVPPLARERSLFKEVRWLAIPNEQTAIFGSVASIRRELDRWIAQVPADATILERLSRLDPRDETWCLLPAPPPDGLVASILGKVDARLAAVAKVGRSIQYGVYFGRNIEITASNNPAAETSRELAFDSPGIVSMAVSYLLSEFSEAPVPSIVRVKVRRQIYEKLLADFSRGGTLIEPFR